MEIKDALPYVGAAYGGIWFVLVVYLINLGRRQAHLEKEAELLSKRLSQTETKNL